MQKWQVLLELLEKKKKVLLGFEDLLDMFREMETIINELRAIEVGWSGGVVVRGGVVKGGVVVRRSVVKGGVVVRGGVVRCDGVRNGEIFVVRRVYLW